MVTQRPSHREPKFSLPITTELLQQLGTAIDDTMVPLDAMLMGQTKMPAQMLEEVRPHLAKIEDLYADGIERALFGVATRQLDGKQSERLLSNFSLPKDYGELRGRLLQSMEYVYSDIEQMKTLEPQAKNYLKDNYMGIVNGMIEVAAHMLQSRSGVRGV